MRMAKISELTQMDIQQVMKLDRLHLISTATNEEKTINLSLVVTAYLIPCMG